MRSSIYNKSSSKAAGIYGERVPDLIASTTENPFFYVYNALLSRSSVFEFKSVPAEEIRPAVLRAWRL